MSTTNDAVKHTASPDAVKHDSTTNAVKHRYPLAEPDAQRMAQLSAEVSARVGEMAQIFTRTTGAAIDGESSRYVPEVSAAADISRVEIVCDGNNCGCYVTLSDGTGWCEYPCGG